MSKIAVLTDTGSNMSVEEGKKLGIYVLPLQIIDGETGYHDLVDINTKQVYDLLREDKMLKTSSPLYSEIEALMKSLKKEGYEHIIYVPITSGLSSTSSTAYMIAEDIDMPLTIIDTYSTVYLQKYVAMKVKELVDASKSVEEIVSIMEEHLANSETLIVVPDLTTLKRGGRVTPAAAAVAGMLKIVPVLQLNKSTNGVIDTLKKVRTEKKAVTTMVETLLEKVVDKDNAVVSIVHSECDELANVCRELFVDFGIKEENIHEVEMNSVISVHTGLGVIGVQYFDDIHA